MGICVAVMHIRNYPAPFKSLYPGRVFNSREINISDSHTHAHAHSHAKYTRIKWRGQWERQLMLHPEPASVHYHAGPVVGSELWMMLTVNIATLPLPWNFRRFFIFYFYYLLYTFYIEYNMWIQNSWLHLTRWTRSHFDSENEDMFRWLSLFLTLLFLTLFRWPSSLISNFKCEKSPKMAAAVWDLWLQVDFKW